MIRLIKFELYKIFTKKSLLIGLVFIVLMYGFVTFQEYQRTKQFNRKGEEFEKFEGPLTEQKIKLAEEGYQEIQKKTIEHTEADGFTWQEFSSEDQRLVGLYEQVSWTQGVQQRKEDLVKELSQTIEKLEQENKKNYKYKKSKLEYTMLKELAKPGIYNSDLLKNILGFFEGLGFLFSGILILLGLSNVFTEEYTTKMDRLILSSKNGKNVIITSKIIASIVYILFISITLSTVNLLMSFSLYGTEGLSLSIQNVVFLSDSPYNLTAIQFYVVEVLINFIAALSFGLLVLAISSISKSVIIPFFIGVMIYLVPVPMYYELDEPWMKPWGDVVRNFNYTFVAKVQSLFNSFKTLNIFGRPILYPYAAITIMIILGILSTIFIYFSFRRHQVKS